MFLLFWYFTMFQYGDTPLHTSARYGHAGVLRILISAKAKVSEQNKVSIIFVFFKHLWNLKNTYLKYELSN
jgi:ankyrin repeat protein